MATPQTHPMTARSFDQLPAELQTLIWQAAARDYPPRLVEVVGRRLVMMFGGVPHLPHQWRVNTPPPSLLHVCRAARSAAQEEFIEFTLETRTVVGDGGNATVGQNVGFRTYVRWRTDIFYINAEDPTGFIDWTLHHRAARHFMAQLSHHTTFATDVVNMALTVEHIGLDYWSSPFPATTYRSLEWLYMVMEDDLWSTAPVRHLTVGQRSTLLEGDDMDLENHVRTQIVFPNHEIYILHGAVSRLRRSIQRSLRGQGIYQWMDQEVRLGDMFHVATLRLRRW